MNNTYFNDLELVSVKVQLAFSFQIPFLLKYNMDIS